jgi:hypothetical protein
MSDNVAIALFLLWMAIVLAAFGETIYVLAHFIAKGW